MHLRTLTVENFRGVRQARLDFDPVTLLIGENDCGKTSLLEALAKALAPGNSDGPYFDSQDFHRPGGDPAVPPAGPIRITLTFQEPALGVWNGSDYAGLAHLLGAAGKRPRQLVLLLEAEPRAGGLPSPARWQIQCAGSGKPGCRDDVELLEAVRALAPFIWLRGGNLIGSPQRSAAEAPAAGPPELAALAEELEAQYLALIAGSAQQPMGKLQSGYQAALAQLALPRPGPAGVNSAARPIIAEILGRRDSPVGHRARASHGSAAEKLGLLILTAAILRHLPQALPPGAHPILALEDPEAHLHPMTLASVWGLLDEIVAQKIITTQSETLLAAAPLRSVRRLTRHEGLIRQWQVHPGALEAEELRKMSYHLRSRRGVASFARCWLLVEGETEFWMLPELARIMGYDLDLEGVACVEFAQCGLAPLIKVAREWGVEWHVLADGDEAGRHYAEATRSFLHGDDPGRRLTTLRERDMEHCFWQYGYADVFLSAAAVHVSPAHRVPPRGVINRAIKRHSKPYMAIEMIMAAAAPNSPGVPRPLRHVVETCVSLARHALQPRGEGGEGRGFEGRERRHKHPRRSR
jgi:putative ATP-dependent endonuclease of OLD family